MNDPWKKNMWYGRLSGWKLWIVIWNLARAPLTAPVIFRSIYINQNYEKRLLIPSYFYLKDMKPSGFYLMYIKSEPWTIISNLGYLLNIVYVYYAFLVWNNVESQGKISENAQGIQCEVVNVCTQKLPNEYVFFQMF